MLDPKQADRIFDEAAERLERERRRVAWRAYAAACLAPCRNVADAASVADNMLKYEEDRFGGAK